MVTLAQVPDLVVSLITAVIGVGGTLLAAGVGVGGLAFVLRRERRERYETRLEATLADVMNALGERLIEIDSARAGAMAQEPTIGMLAAQRLSESPGLPDARLHVTVDIAFMAARGHDLAVLQSIADAIYTLKRARKSFQSAQIGPIVANIRRWRTGELSAAEVIAKMKEFSEGHIASETSWLEQERQSL